MATRSEVELDPRLGTVVAGYRIEALLRRDDAGAVYLAEDLRRGRRVTLRLLDPELAADDGFRERVLRESRLAAALQHPNILPILDAGEADGHVFVALASVAGSDLAHLLERERRLEPERALALAAGVAAALDRARWARGLVHGRVRPSEVLLAPASAGTAERALLMGFGLRQELPPGTTLVDAAGRLGAGGCPAPEQTEGEPIGPRTDVYALGGLVFECLTGRPPFTGDTPEAVLEGHLHGPRPAATASCPELPVALDPVLQRALAHTPEERYPTCTEFADAARRALAPGEGRRERVPETNVSPPVVSPRRPRPRRRAARNRASIPAIGLVALLAALVAGGIWLTGREARDQRSQEPPPAAADTPDQDAPQQAQGTVQAPAEPETTAEPAGDSSQTENALSGEGLVRIDATTGEILDTIPIPEPEGLAADGRAVWTLGSQGLTRLNAATGAVTDIRNPLGRDALAAAGGAAWLGDWDSGQLSRLAPGEPAAEVDFGRGGFYGPVAAAGSLWGTAYLTGSPSFGGRTVLLRVDPVTQRVLARLKGVGEVQVVGKGFLWASARKGYVRIDTKTNTTRPIRSRGWSGRSAADEAVWASTGNGSIVRLDPVTGEETERIRLWRGLARRMREAEVSYWFPLAAGGGAVWVANVLDGEVARYDLATGRITMIDVGGHPWDLVFARGSVWASLPGRLPGPGG
jgi:serine/threonine-protein kinase